MSVVGRALRARWAALAVVLGVAAAAAVVVPVFGSENPDVDVLRMTDVDGDFVVHVDDSGAATSQTLTTKNCVIQDDGPLLAFDSSDRGPGIFDHGMGVKSGGAKGTPCSETDASEWLTISAADGQAWYKLRLDVEAKGDARIEVTLSNEETHVLVTGSSIMDAGLPVPDLSLPYSAETNPLSFIAACADPSDSGPDSKINDNCLWTIESASPFNSLTIGTTTGSVSLEGGNDYLGTSYSDTADQEFASLFFRAGPPTANDDVGDDGYQTNEDTQLSVASPGVLSNDDAVFGGPLTAELVSGPSNGTLIGGLQSDGSFVYAPNLDFNGADSFTYKAIEGGQESNVATVTITVAPVNDAPEGIAGPVEVIEDTPETFTGDDLANDVDGDFLTVVYADAENGSAEVVDGELVYTPAPDFCGDDMVDLTFEVSDGQATTGEVTITVQVECVNDDPVAGADTYETDERDGVNSFVTLHLVPDVLANDSDVDGDTLSASISPSPLTTAEGGTVTQLGDGTFTYDPDPNYDWGTGASQTFQYTDTWLYDVSDGSGGSAIGSVEVTVYRVVCSAETVRGEDVVNSGFFGEFTLLPDLGGEVPCKRYSVSADEADNMVSLEVPVGQGNPVFFSGTLSGSPKSVSGDGSFILGLEYDPQVDGSYQPVLTCDGTPAIDDQGTPSPADDIVTDADIPDDESWCLAGGAFSVVNGQLLHLHFIYGREDPNFRFK